MDKASTKNDSWFSQAEARLYAYPALVAKHRREIDAYRLAAPSPKARNYTATSFIRGTESGSEAERWVLSREKLAQGLLFLEQRVRAEMEAVSTLWEILSAPERQLVYLKYFEQKPAYDIPNALGYSRQHYYAIRRRAVAKAAYIYGFLDYDEYISTI
jgi:ArpU family phage transcriptional regulator